MTRSGRLSRTGMIIVFAMSALVTGAPSAVAHGAGGPNAVTDWSLISQNAVVVGRPPTSAIYLQAMVHVSMYDAVVAIRGGSKPFISSPPATRPADANAAVAAAARDILVARVPGQAASVDAQYATYLAGIVDGAAKSNGIAVGKAAAAAVLLDRTGDGFDTEVPWVQPPTGPGVFEPVAPTTPIDVKFGGVRPFVLRSANQVRPGPPERLGSARYARDFAEVKSLGRAADSDRTPEQTETALFWSENPMIQLNRTLRELAIARGLSLRETARMLAMATVALADSLIVCWNWKYKYVWWRPVHAIQRADTDGNGRTTADPAWQSLLVVNHPEYPSGHGCSTGAMVPALQAYFGTDRVRISVSSTVTGTTRTYARLSRVSKDVFVARIYGGLHFRSTMEAGFGIGEDVARIVARSAFQPKHGRHHH